MSKFWEGIFKDYFADTEANISSDSDIDAPIIALFKDDTNQAMQISLIEELLAQKYFLKELEFLNEETQKLILIKIIQKHPGDILTHEEILRFLLKKLGTEVLLVLNQHPDITWDKIPSGLIHAMLEECQTSEVWELYFHLTNINFIPSATDALFLEDLKKPENVEALEHIAIFLIRNNTQDEILMKKALKVALRNYPLQVKSIIRKNEHIQQLLLSMLLEETKSIEEWDTYFKFKNIKFECGENHADFIQVLNQPVNINALNHLLPHLLNRSKIDSSILTKMSKEILQANIQSIPMDSIILLDSHEHFKNHPLYALFFKKPAWESLFADHMVTLIEFTPKAIKKLFQSSDENPLMAAINFGNEEAIQWVLTSLLKLEDLQYSKKIIQEFLDSKQKITTENTDILKLFIKHLLDNPEQTKVLKTIKDKCKTKLEMSKVLISLKNEFKEDELYRLLTEDFNGGRTLFMEELYTGDNSTNRELLHIIMSITKNNGEKRNQIFSQKSNYGSNVLMLAAQYHPEYVPEILKAMVETEDKVFMVSVLSQKNKDGWNALMVAARYHSECVPEILKVMDEIEDTALLCSVLKQTQKDGWNALMLATRYQPEATSLIIEAILNLPDIPSQKNIFEYEFERWIGDFKNKEKLSFISLLKFRVYHPLVYKRLQIENSGIDRIVKRNFMNQYLIDWQQFIANNRSDFEGVEPKFLTFSPNILIQCAQLKNDEAWIAVFLKMQDLQKIDPHAAYKIIQEFIVSEQKITTENTDILKLFIKLLLDNPEQKRVLKTVKDKCKTKLDMSKVLISLKNEFKEDELYRLLTEDFNDNRTFFMEEFYRGDNSTSIDLLNIIMAIIKNNGEKRNQTFIQKNKYGSNILMAAARHHPECVPEILKAIDEIEDKELMVSVLRQMTKGGWNALMLAARHHPKCVPEILKAIVETKNTALMDSVLRQKDTEGWNALMLAARYHPECVPEILKAMVETKNTALMSSVLSQTNIDDWNALMLAARYQPAAVSEILKAIESLQISDRIEIFIAASDKIQESNSEIFIPYLFNIIKCHIQQDQYNPKFKMKVKNTNFNIMQAIYHIHGWLVNNSKNLKRSQLEKLKKFISEINDSESGVEKSEILLRLREFSREINQAEFKKLITDLEQNIRAYQIEQIQWPEAEPYSLIEDKKSIDSIISGMPPQKLMDADISTFKSIFKTFPEDWKSRYLHQCKISLVKSFYEKIYDELQSIETVLIDVKAKAASAPPEPFDLVAKQSNDDSLVIADAVMVSSNFEKDADLNETIDGVVVEDFSGFWKDAKGMDEKEFVYQLQTLDDIEIIYDFIHYMRTSPLMGPVYQNIQIIRKWIEKSPEIRKQFHLHELAYFAKHYENLANQIKDNSSPKKTALMNLSMDLLKLREGMTLIYRQIKEAPNNASYQESLSIYEDNLKIYQMHLDFLRHYLDRFETFKQTYPRVLDFTSSLFLPSGAYAHTLLEISLRKPTPPIKIKTCNKPLAIEHPALLIHKVKDETKNFVAQVKEKANVPAFFTATEESGKKNLLILALETKDIVKINAVAQTIYEFDEAERTKILEMCNQKGYRLTSYIRQKTPYLCLLELERLVLKLEKLNSSDPNIRILKELAIHLRSNPNDYVSDIEKARNDIRKNSSWRQWFGGGYNKTDYGIGIFKETIDGLLDKIENAEKIILQNRK